MAGSTEEPARSTEARVELPSRRGNRLVGLWAAPPESSAPVVILCHGMESTKEGTKHRLLVDRLRAAGFGTLRFDFSYVGESEGEFADLTIRGEVEDLGGAFDYVAARTEGPLGLFGSSLGGTVSLLFAATEPRIAAVAVVAAVAHPKRILDEVRPDELARWRREGTFSLGGVTLRSTFVEDLETLDVLGACRGIAAPVLVLHGDADRVVPIGDGEAIAATRSGAAPRELRVFPGCDHRFSRAEDLERLLEACEVWFRRHLSGGGGVR
jgi:uncharacterized protein